MTGLTVKLGATSLMYACQQGKESQVNEIIQTKPDTILERERSLKTALHYCAESGDGGVESAAALLRVAPELVFAQDQDGYTPLHLAVIAGNVQLAKLLISQGADVNTTDNEGHTSAHWATVCGEIECLELILKKKADPNIGDMHGGCPLHYAAQMCGPGSEMPGDRRLGMTALRLLINHSANPNIPDNHGRQPVLWAASAGSSEAILVLTNAGANVEAADKDGLTALHCAASRGHTDCVETLISLCNAETDVIDNNGCSALFYAVTLGHADCTQSLLNHGANTNRQDRKGRTAMHCGAAKGQMETLKVVWSRGGNLWTRTARGDYPLHEAVTSGRTDLVLWLLSLRPDSVNAPNNDGRCPLHLAAIHNNVEMCKVLLDAGSLVNPVMRTAKGMLATPLDAALHKGHRGTAKYLQVHGGVPAARLNSESAALRGPNTRNLGAYSQKPLDSEKEKSNAGEQMTNRTMVQPTPNENFQIGGQKQILQVYVEDGVMIRRIKHSQVGEAEERVKRRRKKRKTKYILEKNYLRSKERHGKRGYEGSTDEDGYTSQDSSIEDSKIRVESDSEHGPRHHTDSALVNENSMLEKNEIDNELLPSNVISEDCSATEIKQDTQTTDSLSCSIKDSESRSELKDESSGQLKDFIRKGEETVANKELQMEGSEVKKSELENNIETCEATNKISLINEGIKIPGETTEEKFNLEMEEDIKVDRSTAGSVIHKNELENNEHVDNDETPSSRAITGNNGPENQSFLEINCNDQLNFSEKTIFTVESKQSEENELNENVNKETESQGDMEVNEVNPDLKKTNDGTSEKKGSKEDDNYISPEINSNSNNITGKGQASLDESRVENQEINEAKVTEGELFQESDEFTSKKVETDLNKADPSPSTENEKETMSTLSNENKDQDITQNNPILITEENKKINEEANSILITEEKKRINKETDILNESTTIKSMSEDNQDSADSVIDYVDKESKDTEVEQETRESSNEIEYPEENHELSNTDITINDEHGNSHDSISGSLKEDVDQLNENEENNKDDTLSEEEVETIDSDIVNGDEKEDKEFSSSESIIDEPGHMIKTNTTSKSIRDDINKISEPVLKEGINLKNGEKLEKNVKLKNNKKDRGLIKVLSDEKIPSSTTREGKKKQKRKEWKRQRSNESWEPHSISPQLVEDGFISGNVTPTEHPQIQDSGVELSSRRHKNKEDTRSRSNNRIPRICNKGYGDKDKDMPLSTVSVTQAVQYSIRKYHLERRIFHQLLELKRLQIRAGRSSESVLVKRLVDDYRRAGLMLGLQQYNGVYTFRAFEKYLYDQLRLLQSSERRIIPRLKSSDDLEKLTAALRKTRAGQDILMSIPSNPALCTYQTHRCHHATHAYTGIPCAAYIKKNHHTMPKPGSFLPRLVNDEGHNELAKTLRFVDPSRPLTLELSHGSEKQVITLPTEKLDKSKRYFVTFTIKTGNQKKSEENHAHTHASSV